MDKNMYNTSGSIIAFFLLMFCLHPFGCGVHIVLEKNPESKETRDGGSVVDAVVQRDENVGETIEENRGQADKNECMEGEKRTCFEGRGRPTPPCREGIQVCHLGKWGACQGQIQPKPEVCNGLDDNCDGRIDSPPPDTVSCYTGPPETRNVGQCAEGHLACINGKLTYCELQRFPTDEVCDSADNNCNGKVDEGDVCKTIPNTENMLNIPEGEFDLGTSLQKEPLAVFSEMPSVKTFLSSFSIDKYEVTNAAYRDCIEAKVCSPATLPKDLRGHPRFPKDYLANPKYNLFPVVGVSWRQARAYCIWKGKELPTEAQWEKAAKSKNAKRYPWGDSIPRTCEFANNIVGLDSGAIFLCNHHPARVGSYKKDMSQSGMFDPVGNVKEWTRDCYSGAFYKSSQYLKNPLNKECDTGSQPVNSPRTVRGGSFLDRIRAGRLTKREGMQGDTAFIDVGFRCVTQK